MSMNPQVIEFFAKFIFAELGIVYAEVNHYQLEARLKDVARQLDFPDVETFHAAATRNFLPAMKALVLDLATNNETLFFRDPAVFTAIEAVVMAGAARPSAKPLRVWSAACSTGQEVYSLAILFERLSVKAPGFRYEILASDVSDRVLRQAEAGCYSQMQIDRGLAPADVARYFKPKEIRQDGANGNASAAGGKDVMGTSPAETQWQIQPELRRHITFKRINLLESFASIGTFDLILCRNVLIYQATPRKQEIVSQMYARLEEDGHLILGAAESLIGISDRFEMVRAERATIYRKPSNALQKLG